jgi:hypothetical protein
VASAARAATGGEVAITFSEYMWAMDIGEVPQQRPPGFEGWWPDEESGYPDIEAVVDRDTLCSVPWLERTAVALCNYRHGRDRA